MAIKQYEDKYEGVSQDIGNPNFSGDEKGDYSLYLLRKHGKTLKLLEKSRKKNMKKE